MRVAERAGMLFRIAVAAALGLSLGSVRPAPAQEARAQTLPDKSRARIGVYLEESCDAGPGRVDMTEALASCDRAPVVRSVAVGGPADRSGMQAGDTLLAIEGVSAASEAGRRLLAGLEDGESVSIEVGRASGRLRLDVVPVVMPPRAWVTVRTRQGPLDGEERSIRVLRLPDLHIETPRPGAPPESVRTAGSAFVFFHEDSLGTFHVEVGGTDGLREDLIRIPGAPRYVWENEELARRLEEVRRTSLRSARARLDSLLRVHGRALARVEERDPRDGRDAVVEPRPEWSQRGDDAARKRDLPGEVRVLLLPDRRVAGAEFRELTSELSEYFQGTDGGLLVLRVIPGTPAARLGLRGGDVVVEAGGRICRDVGTLRAILEQHPPGGIDVKWIRKGIAHAGRLIDS